MFRLDSETSFNFHLVIYPAIDDCASIEQLLCSFVLYCAISSYFSRCLNITHWKDFLDWEGFRDKISFSLFVKAHDRILRMYWTNIVLVSNILHYIELLLGNVYIRHTFKNLTFLMDSEKSFHFLLELNPATDNCEKIELLDFLRKK